MNRLLLLCFIACSIYSTSGFKLHTLCKNDSFKINNPIYHFFMINGTVEFSLDYKVPKFNSLILSNALNFSGWSKNQNEVDALEQKRDEFNKIVFDFHTEKNIDALTKDQLENLFNSTEKIEKYFDQYESKLNLEEKSTYYTIKATTNRTLELLNNLKSLKVNERINLNILPEAELIKLLNLAYKIRNLTFPLSLTFGHYGSYYYRPIHRSYYYRPIARYNKFITNDPESESIIDYTYFVPVQKNTAQDPNETCLTSTNLTRYYKEKKPY